MTSIISSSYSLHLWFKHSYVIVAIMDWKYELLSKHLFQRTQQCGGRKKTLEHKLVQKKIISFSYHMEWKIFIEANCSNNLHTRENIFCNCWFWRFVSRFISDRVKQCIFRYVKVFFTFLEKGRSNKYRLWEANLVFCMQIFSLMSQRDNLKYSS